MHVYKLDCSFGIHSQIGCHYHLQPNTPCVTTSACRALTNCIFRFHSVADPIISGRACYVRLVHGMNGISQKMQICGIRIARLGLEVICLNSTTLEEANSQLGNWIRQRSRWIKGHIQTWLIHNRNPVRLWHELGAFRFFAFQLSIGLPAMIYLVNPFLYAIAVVWVIGGGEIVEPILSSNASAINSFSFVMGTFLVIGQLMLACAKGRIAVQFWPASLRRLTGC